MRPATPQRYVVRARDYDLWQVVVEAQGRDDAIAKAKSLYATDGLGITDTFTFVERSVSWHAYPLVREVVR